MSELDLDALYADPVNAPFWAGAEIHELRIQRCKDCGAFQHYGRPFCLGCDSEAIEWVRAAGTGVVYSVTTVRMKIVDSVEPPYQVALVDLAEGPRLMATIVGADVAIGDGVVIDWKSRDAAPPLPVFRASEPA